jgi:hypothetical protein
MDTPITISDRHLTIGALIFLSAGRLVFSVHTGALLWGAAGVLRGRQATHTGLSGILCPTMGHTNSVACRR